MVERKQHVENMEQKVHDLDSLDNIGALLHTCYAEPKVTLTSEVTSRFTSNIYARCEPGLPDVCERYQEEKKKYGGKPCPLYRGIGRIKVGDIVISVKGLRA